MCCLCSPVGLSSSLVNGRPRSCSFLSAGCSCCRQLVVELWMHRADLEREEVLLRQSTAALSPAPNAPATAAAITPPGGNPPAIDVAERKLTLIVTTKDRCSAKAWSSAAQQGSSAQLMHTNCDEKSIRQAPRRSAAGAPDRPSPQRSRGPAHWRQQRLKAAGCRWSGAPRIGGVPAGTARLMFRGGAVVAAGLAAHQAPHRRQQGRRLPPPPGACRRQQRRRLLVRRRLAPRRVVVAGAR